MGNKITMEGKYQTRDGKPARVICLDAKDYHYPVIALVPDSEGRDEIITYTADGCVYSEREHISDLVSLKENKTVYVNFFPNGTATWYDNKPDAVFYCPKGAITKAAPVETEIEP